MLFLGKCIKMSNNPTYFVSDLYKTEYGMRSLFTEDMEHFYNCIQIDNLFFAQCFIVEDFENIQISGCNLEIKKDIQINNNIDAETFNIIVGEKMVHTKEESQLKFPCYNNNEGQLKISSYYNSTRDSLDTWIKDITDPNLLWDHFTKSFSPINQEHPVIDILFPMFVNRPKFNNSAVTIETLHGESLFHGKLRNGHLKGKVPTEKIDHPGWRTRLKIILDRYNYGRHNSNNIIVSDYTNLKFFFQKVLTN